MAKLESARGNKVESRSSRRYHVVADFGSRAFIEFRSDDLAKAKKRAAKLGGEYDFDNRGDDGLPVFVKNAIVVDVVSGEVAR